MPGSVRDSSPTRIDPISNEQLVAVTGGKKQSAHPAPRRAKPSDNLCADVPELERAACVLKAIKAGELD